VNKFVILRLKWAIYHLEVINKLRPNTIDSYLIIELKNTLEKVSEN
jgi:hypothetical protein